jgi:hypothetical protein
VLKDAPCKLAVRRTPGLTMKRATPIPHDACACDGFELNPWAPDLARCG